LRKLIKEHRIQIVHGYQPIDGINLFLATRGLGNVKKVLSFQGFIQNTKHRLASQFLVSRMDANISVSNGLAKILHDEDGVNISKKFHIVYNGADPARIAPSGRSVRTELNIDPNAIVFGMTANFYRDRRKDQLTICKALPKVFSELGNAHFIFAGGIERGAEEKAGECMRICREEGISDRVNFLGSRNDVADILQALDVYVFSSYYEGLPVAVTEAMLAGVPMIVSDIEPLREATGNGQYAEIFPVEDVETLANKMLGLATNEDARRTQAEQAQQFARDNFSIDAHLRELKKIYEKLL
jgi:glycosyltransferase involved in cell wall biosynthesis